MPNFQSAEISHGTRIGNITVDYCQEISKLLPIRLVWTKPAAIEPLRQTHRPYP